MSKGVENRARRSREPDPAQRARETPKRTAGITLLELMAVVMVLGVLGMIAVPGYRQYLVRAQRTEAKTALLRLAANQERFYLANRRYSGSALELGFPNGQTERGTYALSIVGADMNGYTATAAPRVGAATDMRTDAACTSFSINAQGERTATGSAAETCW